MRRGPSTRSTPSACPRPAPTSGPVAPPASVRDGPAGCGTRATGCVPMASRTSRASIWPGRCSIWRRGGPIPTRSRGSRRRRRRPWPPPARLLQRLGALDGGALTPLGRRMQALPLPPRLARILIEAGGARDAARACAILSERQLAPARREATTCDLLGSLDAWASLPPHVHQVARQIEDLSAGLASAAPRTAPGTGFAEVGPAAGVVRRLRRSPGPAPRGRRARRWCWRPGPAPSSAVRAASATASSWSRSTCRRRPRAGRSQRAGARREPCRAGVDRRRPRSPSSTPSITAAAGSGPGAASASIGLVLAEHAQAPDPLVAAEVLAQAWLARSAATRATTAGSGAVRFAGLEIDLPALVRQAAQGAASIADIDLAAHAPYAVARDLERLAPTHLDLPSGRRTCAGLRGTRAPSRRRRSCRSSSAWPRRLAIGPSATPVVLSLLAPNGRPVQTTSDLRSFWDEHLSRGPARAARPVSAASLARGSVDRDAHGESQATAAFLTAAVRRLANRRPGHQSFANAGPSNRLRVRPARAGRRGRPYRGPDLVQCQPANRVRTGR